MEEYFKRFETGLGGQGIGQGNEGSKKVLALVYGGSYIACGRRVSTAHRKGSGTGLAVVECGGSLVGGPRGGSGKT